MLVLTRKSNQSIMIGDDIEVSVLSVMGDKVRIGIQAPQEVPVFRTEIYFEIHRKDGDAPMDVREEVDEALRDLGESSALSESTQRQHSARRAPLSSPAEQQVEHAEHHRGDDHRGRDEREDEQDEADRAALVTAVDFAFERALLGGPLQRVAAAALERDLFGKRPLELAKALAHPHRGRLDAPDGVLTDRRSVSKRCAWHATQGGWAC